MAVYQISKIQIRRGKARSGPGFPQLASGELGWAVDAQELYIGNGSIAEGAPTVGNTKILTSKDIVSGGSGLISILQHTYKSQDGTIITGPNSSFPIVRSLQTELDDNVSTSSFGAVGDGVTDDTFAIQRAINQLFANLNLKSFLNTGDGVKRRVILKIPAGIFIISNALVIPSYATLVGAGIDKTIIQYTGLTTAVRFSSDADSTYTNTRPRYTHIEGITIKSIELATIGLDINNVTDSVFRDIKLVGNWSLGTSLENKGINIVNSERLFLNNIAIENFYYGMYVGDVVSSVEFNTGSISVTNYGIAVGVDLIDTQSGANNFHISNINFNQILSNGVKSYIGSSNSITNCSFTEVGGDNTAPMVPQLYFETPVFTCSDIRSDRSNVLSGASLSLPTYIPEVSGTGTYTSADASITLVVTAINSTAFKLPLRTNSSGNIDGAISYTIDYVFNGLFNRQGTILISANAPSVVSSEDYTCDTTSSNSILLDFKVAIVNNSIVVSYTNTLANNPGILTYSYKSKF
jgi:Pectate lyase superfamily protein/Major tropism determinant N-terminal domain